MSLSSLSEREVSRGLRRVVPAHWVVCYDIGDDRRRRRVEQVLRGAGRRVQESLFECRLTTGLAMVTRRRIDSMLDRAVDSVRWYRVCDACLSRVQHLDVRPSVRDYGYTLV